MKSLIFNIDYNHQPLNIGDFVLNLLVCSVLLDEHKLDCVDVNIICDPTVKHPDAQLESLLSHSNKKRKIYDIIQMLQLLQGVRSINFHEKPAELINSLKYDRDQDKVFWPTMEKLEKNEYMFYEAVQLLNRHILENKTYPYLCFSDYQIHYALKFYRNNVYPNVPITVNLRNNPFFHGNRNGLLEEWKKFFTMAADKYPVKFVIVGSFSEIDHEIAILKNVVYAKQHCTSLVDDLSLLYYSAFHLGNASGPSLLNYFSANPYYIFNCDMKPHLHRYCGALIEESDSLRYAFATPYQNFGIVPETAEGINFQFEKIWNSADWLEWAFVDFYKRKPAEIPYWF